MVRTFDRDLVIKYFVWALVFVYPTSALLIKSSLSLAMLVMVLLGSVILFKDWRGGELAGHACEKLLLKFGLAGLAVSLVSLLAGGRLVEISSAELDYFDKQLRFLFFVPFLVLMKRTGVPEKLIWWGAVTAALCAGFYSIAIKIVSPETVRISAINNPINFGYFSVIAAFVSINGLFFFIKRKKYLFFLPVVAFFMGLTGTILSGSRGAWLAIPILLVVTIFNFTRHCKPVYVFSAVLSGFALAAVIGASVESSIVQTRLAQVSGGVEKYFAARDDLKPWESVGVRLEMYRVALAMIEDNPLLGVGPGRYQYTVIEDIGSGKTSKVIDRFKYPHNDYLTVAACTGVPGLIIFLITVYFLPLYILYVSSGRDPGQPLFWAGVIIVTGYMVFALSNTTLFKNVRIYYYCLTLCAICASLQGRADATKNERGNMLSRKPA
jgi:O-antigen ligase